MVFRQLGRPAWLIMAIALLLSPVLVSCHKVVSVWFDNSKTPLVSIGDDVLYEEDLDQAMPIGLSGEDSALFAAQYIKNWAQDILFYRNAVRNISNTHDIDRLVENYRRSLIEHEYQRRLVEQKFTSNISDDEIESFYNENKQLFKLEGALVKCLFLKVPSASRDLGRFRKLYTLMDDVSFEEIEKLSIRNSARCEFRYDYRCGLNEIEVLLPQHDIPLEKRLAGAGHFEYSDSAFVYLLNVSEYIPNGGIAPLDNVSDRIRSLLVNSNEVGYMRSIKEDLYRRALDNDLIVFQKDNEDNGQK